MDNLLDIIKRQLGYLWVTESQAQVLEDVAHEGIAFLQRYDETITEENILEDYTTRALLINYCRYSLANALDDFPHNYKTELIKLSNRGRKNRANAQQEETE